MFTIIACCRSDLVGQGACSSACNDAGDSASAYRHLLLCCLLVFRCFHEVMRPFCLVPMHGSREPPRLAPVCISKSIGCPASAAAKPALVSRPQPQQAPPPLNVGPSTGEDPSVMIQVSWLAGGTHDQLMTPTSHRPSCRTLTSHQPCATRCFWPSNSNHSLAPTVLL